MTSRQQWALVGAVIALLALALVAGTHYLGDELFPVSVGSDAPPFSATTLDATPRVRTLADYKGRVVLLNVWATWCEPCRVEMPSIEKLTHEFAGQGLAVVAVSVDDAGTEQHIRDFAKELGLSFEILHDPTQVTKTNYQITGFPETFIIGREGKIRKKVLGSSTASR
jgi:cytochrome c biogenesis protein CcmG/thiol:disulfide interchange protein DsbE